MVNWAIQNALPLFVDFERLQAKTDSNMEDQPSLVSFREWGKNQ